MGTWQSVGVILTNRRNDCRYCDWTGQDTVSGSKRSRVPVRGRACGLKGGAVRAQTFSARRRSSIAAKAAKARWKKV
jgi:hypothetical protein